MKKIYTKSSKTRELEVSEITKELSLKELEKEVEKRLYIEEVKKTDNTTSYEEMDQNEKNEFNKKMQTRYIKKYQSLTFKSAIFELILILIMIASFIIWLSLTLGSVGTPKIINRILIITPLVIFVYLSLTSYKIQEINRWIMQKIKEFHSKRKEKRKAELEEFKRMKKEENKKNK